MRRKSTNKRKAWFIFVSLCCLSPLLNAEKIPACPEDIVVLERVPPRQTDTRRPMEGWVMIEGVVQTYGTIQDVSVIDSEPKGRFDKMTIRAFSQWKFEWYGEPCIYTTTFTYLLENENKNE